MPDPHSANITANLMQRAARSTVTGPILIVLTKPAQFVRFSTTMNDLVTVAAPDTQGAEHTGPSEVSCAIAAWNLIWPQYSGGKRL